MNVKVIHVNTMHLAQMASTHLNAGVSQAGPEQNVKQVRISANSRKSVRWSAEPVPCLSLFCFNLREGAGQWPQRGR